MWSALTDAIWQALVILSLVSAFTALNYIFPTAVLYHRIRHVEV